MIGLVLPAFTRYRRRPDYPDGEGRVDVGECAAGGDRVDWSEYSGGDSHTGEGRPAIVDAGLA